MNIFRTLISSINARTLSARNLRKSIEEVVSGSVRPFDLLTNRGKVPKKSPEDLIAHYKSWAYTCANRNASAVAKANLRLYATRSSNEPRSRAKARLCSAAEVKTLRKGVANNPRLNGASEVEEIVEHPFLDLMKNVNPFHNQFDTMESLSLYLDCTGDSYWYIIDGPLGIPAQLWTLPSQYVRIVPDEINFLKGYLYGRNMTDPKKFHPEEIIHFKRNNPMDLYYGMGRIEGAFWAIIGYESFEKFEYNQTETHGLKDILISYKQGLNSGKRKELLAEWSRAINYASAEHAPLIADGDATIKDVSWSPKELAFMQGRQWRKDEIINAFGQHASMFDKNANTANIQGGIYLWEKFEVTATLTRIQQKLNEKMIPRYGEPRLFVAFDLVVDSDKEQDRKDYELLLKNGYPLNDILAKLSIDPVEGGDQGYISNTLVPLGTPPSTPANTEPRTGNATRSQHNGMAARSNAFLVGHLSQKADDNDRSGGHNPPLTPSEKKIKANMAAVWKQQKPKAVQEAAKGAAADFDWVASEEWADEIVALTSGTLKTEIVLGAKEGAKKIGVQMTDFIDRPEAQDAIRNHGFDFARAVGNDSVSKLKQTMSLGIEQGESIPELTKRIGVTFDDWEKWRAERVARTESARALMLGQEAQWQASGVVSEKVWDAAGDACPFCIDMNGKTLELGRSFWTVDGPNQTVDFEGKDITLKHEYLNVQGPPLHPNCRCTLQAQLIEM